MVYDCVFIGSGPISILESYFLHKQGKKVLLIDEKKQIGGAWVTIDVGNYGQLEIGCHIWSYHREVYSFLERFLSLNLIKLSPQPYFLKGKTKLIYDHKNALITTKRSLKHFLRLDFKALLAFLKSDPSARIPIIPKTYLYPKGGAREFQKALENKIYNSDIDLALNTKITEIEKKDNIWVLKTNTDQEIQSKKIILTSTSSIGKINFENQTIKIKHEQVYYTHFHVALKGKLKKPFSYIRVLNHPFIHRLSDISQQLNSDQKEDVSMLIIGVLDNKIEQYSNDKSVVFSILEYLQMQGFTNEKNQVLYFHKNRFETKYIGEEQKSKINLLDPSLTLLNSTDLIYGIHYRFSDWIEKEDLLD